MSSFFLKFSKKERQTKKYAYLEQIVKQRTLWNYNKKKIHWYFSLNELAD